MGIAFKDLFQSKETSIEELKGKVLVIDSYNMLYQFLTTIRSRDGSLLTDSKGNVTSHLVGLFSRLSNFIEKGLKLVFVFDGKPPELKKQESQRRKEIKKEAEKKYKEALDKHDLDEMKKFASRTTKLTKEMIFQAKELISAFGIPIIDAPSEGEAQAAFIVGKGDGYAVVSQDYDSLVHGSPIIIRNLSISGKRKRNNKLKYETIKPEIINLSENLNNLGIDKNQLIILSMLIGTDYNPGGIKGIGPKNALKLVKEFKTDFDTLFKKVEWNNYFDTKWEEIYYLFKKMPTKEDYKLEWNPINFQKINEILIQNHDFSKERISKTIEKLLKQKEQRQQKGLREFI